MTTSEILRFLQSDIHSAIFATLDHEGLPVTCVIDIMMADENSLYFLTAIYLMSPRQGKLLSGRFASKEISQRLLQPF